MNFSENIKTALAAISSNKLRSFLTMLGVIIGVYAVSTMLALGQMATNMITGELNDLAGKTIAVYPDWSKSTRYITFGQNDVDALASLPIQNISTVSGNAKVATSLKSGAMSLIGATSNYYKEASGIKISSGRYFNDDEVRGSAASVVLNEKAVTKYFGKTNPIGKTLRIRIDKNDGGYIQDQLTVIGVIKNSGGLFGGLESEYGHVPISYAWRYFATRNEYDSLTFKVPAYVESETIKKDVTRILVSHRGEKDFDVNSSEQFIDQFKSITSVLQISLAGIGGLSLLVGGIGIMNIMLVSVTERTREIGLRKAVGARNSTILSQFLIEAVTLTGLGGLVGYALSVLTVFSITLLFPQFFPKMVLSPSVAFLALGVSMFIGLVFGVWPANRAARLTPIEALRHE